MPQYHPLDPADQASFDYLMAYAPNAEQQRAYQQLVDSLPPLPHQRAPETERVPVRRHVTRAAATRTRAPRRTATRSRRPGHRRRSTIHTASGSPGDSDPAAAPGDRRRHAQVAS